MEYTNGEGKSRNDDDNYVCDRCNDKDFMKTTGVELNFGNTFDSYHRAKCDFNSANSISTETPIEIYD